MPDYLPQRDADLVTYGEHFSAVLTADPEALGQSSDVAIDVAASVAAYKAAFIAAVNPDTRGGSTVFAKDQARKAMVALIRAVVARIQVSPIVTDQQRYDLGIPVHKTERTPSGVPDLAPAILVHRQMPTAVDVLVVDAATMKRRKPQYAVSAAVLSYVGNAPPTDVGAWKWEGTTTRSSFTVQFDPDIAPGSKVWLVATWQNARGFTSPACQPVSLRLTGNVAEAG